MCTLICFSCLIILFSCYDPPEAYEDADPSKKNDMIRDYVAMGTKNLGWLSKYVETYEQGHKRQLAVEDGMMTRLTPMQAPTPYPPPSAFIQYNNMLRIRLVTIELWGRMGGKKIKNEDR